MTPPPASELEERKTEKALKLQLSEISLAAEKRAVAERALEEKKLALEEKKKLLTHEMSQKELDLKAKQITESSDDGGSDTEVPRRGKRVHSPRGLVTSFVEGGDIDNWFGAYEVALGMHQVPEQV